MCAPRISLKFRFFICQNQLIWPEGWPQKFLLQLLSQYVALKNYYRNSTKGVHKNAHAHNTIIQCVVIVFISSNSLALYKFLTQYNASDPVQNKNVSGRSGIVVTMSDYYNETVEEQKIWNKTYMNLHLTRKLITGCANEDVAK